MNDQTNFITLINKKAIDSCVNTRLFPSLMIAQVILESNWGKSLLSKLHHNYFGIKANPIWTGEKVTYTTTEYVKGKPVKIPQNFRAYPSIDAGFADRVNFLHVNKRYTTSGVFKAKSPEQQAEAFLKAGYATDPNYPGKLTALISKYKLKQYDE